MVTPVLDMERVLTQSAIAIDFFLEKIARLAVNS